MTRWRILSIPLFFPQLVDELKVLKIKYLYILVIYFWCTIFKNDTIGFCCLLSATPYKGIRRFCLNRTHTMVQIAPQAVTTQLCECVCVWKWAVCGCGCDGLPLAVIRNHWAVLWSVLMKLSAPAILAGGATAQRKTNRTPKIRLQNWKQIFE